MEYKPTRVINVKVAELRSDGYPTLDAWLQASPEHVYIGRRVVYVKGAEHSKWHNPFSVKKFGIDQCLAKYEDYIRNNENLWNSLSELNGKQLGCWCAPGPCHGHILVKLLQNRG